jgi:glycosyltransferase involved in cell wall biosynthesis
LTRWALANANRVVAISMETANNVEKMVSRKVEVIYEGIDTNKFKPSSLDCSKQSMVLSVGLMTKGNSKRKGFSTLITCFSLVLKEFTDATLVIVGKKGDGYPALQALVDELGISNHVVFTGYVSDIELLNLYDRCTLFALPSVHEGFPTVLSEALACEKPVVTARGSAVSEVVDEENGFLVDDPFSAEELANAILILLRNPALRDGLGKEGRRTIVEWFSRDIRKQKLKSLFGALIL